MRNNRCSSLLVLWRQWGFERLHDMPLSGKSNMALNLSLSNSSVLDQGITQGHAICVLEQRCQAEGVNGRWNPARTLLAAVTIWRQRHLLLAAAPPWLPFYSIILMDWVSEEWGTRIQMLQWQGWPQIHEDALRLWGGFHLLPLSLLVFCWVWVAQDSEGVGQSGRRPTSFT